MHIQLNGEARDRAPGTTIAALLQAEGLAERRVAVEVNGEIVPRSRHAAATLRDGDRVEIVHALGERKDLEPAPVEQSILRRHLVRK